MDQNKVDNYLMANAKYLPQDKIMFVKDKLANLSDDRWTMISSVEFKDPTTITIVSVFLGSLGIDRFMLGDTGMGILKLLTAGLCGILTLIDWFTISKKAREFNYQKLMTIL